MAEPCPMGYRVTRKIECHSAFCLVASLLGTYPIEHSRSLSNPYLVNFVPKRFKGSGKL